MYLKKLADWVLGDPLAKFISMSDAQLHCLKKEHLKLKLLNFASKIKVEWLWTPIYR